MAIAFVNKAVPSGGQSTIPAGSALTWTPTIGNSLFVVYWTDTTTPVPASLSDTYGNAYVKIAEQTGSNTCVQLWWCASITATGASNIVTSSTLATSQRFKIEVFEFSGLAGTVDKFAAKTAAQTTTETITNSGANTGTNDLVISLLNLGNGTPPSGLSNPPAGYTTLNWLDFNSGWTNVGQVSAYKINSGTGGTDSCTWNWTAKGAAWTADIIASFGAGAGAMVGTEQVLLDDPARVGGSSQLFLGTVADDNTGDALRTGGLDLKTWAADINVMFTSLFRRSQTIGDVNLTLLITEPKKFIYVNATLTANRTITLPGAAGMKDGMQFKVVRRAATPGAFTLTVADPLSGRNVSIAANTNGFIDVRAIGNTEWLCEAQGTIP